MTCIYAFLLTDSRFAVNLSRRNLLGSWGAPRSYRRWKHFHGVLLLGVGQMGGFLREFHSFFILFIHYFLFKYSSLDTMFPNCLFLHSSALKIYTEIVVYILIISLLQFYVSRFLEEQNRRVLLFCWNC